MSKHIVFTFLSTVRMVNDKAEWKEARETEYTNLEGEKARTTNESAIRYLMQKYKGEDIARIFVFASEAVRGEKQKFNSAEFGRALTHLEYFRERMRRFIPYIDECMPETAIYPYDEKATVVESLRSVTRIAEWMQNFAGAAGEDTVLHVDLTGGMRSANMMMLDVVRLMEYSGVRIGSLLYSNYNGSTKLGKVEELGDIYELFGLISGAEEFIRFGSAEALNDYYQKKSQSRQLHRLLKAMASFAEEIKLCHYGQLEKAIIELHEAVQGFEAKGSEDLQELLMGRMIERIRSEYFDLTVKRKLDDIKVIKWCLKHGYMQQAMTLYTERIPEYLGEQGMIGLPLEVAEKLEKLVENDEMNRNSWYFLLNECKKVCDSVAEKPTAKETEGQKEKGKNIVYKQWGERSKELAEGERLFCTSVKQDVVRSLMPKKPNFDCEKWWEKILVIMDKYQMCMDEERAALLRKEILLLQEAKANPKIMLELSDPQLEPLQPVIEKLSGELNGMEKGYTRIGRILEYLQKECRAEDMKQFFPRPVSQDRLEADYPHAMVEYYMIKNNIFKPLIGTERFLSIMEKYICIKDERNHSNHARRDQGEFSSTEELKEYMLAGLEELENASV